ncbi:peptidase [Streptomyces zinciresistens K42]|uniref:Peptidase n=1 Tax=Streptomyces zinciresistens K42 TaxID=700597 RepID=G2GCT9_9ACTN|nr:alpha/beta fold hydrolase [Streptomyces zinciresistens]EGX58676.1 peptidase [Streptomyces zinciresistens K42]
MAGLVRWAALLAAAALLATGCGGGSSGGPEAGGGPGGASSPPTSADGPAPLPASLTSQKLDWGECKASEGSPAPGGGWRCATLRAPLDWSKPKGRTIGLALIRAEATGGDRIGSLLFNFGGPGSSGLSTMPWYASYTAELNKRYDLVSWDPRGVGASAGVRCRGDEEVQASESVDVTPDTPDEERAFLRDAAAFGQSCRKAEGQLMAHVSTTDTARDMDLMRQVLGDGRMRYFGISYGTELGGVYAHLFPKRVGRLILDAVADPSADSAGHAENQARGFQRALDNYLRSTGQDAGSGTRRIAALLKRIDARPLPTSSDRELTETLALTGIIRPLYSKAGWPVLTRALEGAERGDGTRLLALADEYNDRNPSGRYGTGAQSQRVISCLDDKQRPTLAQTRRLLPRFEKVSPVFGPMLGWDTVGWCYGWPVAGRSATPEVSAAGAAPILLVGNTGDPATPYEGTRRMADELGKGVGVTLTWKGEGHGAYGKGSSCVDSAVNAYLLEGTVPRDGKVCG